MNFLLGLLDVSLIIACYNEEIYFKNSIEQIVIVLDNTKFN
jgi:glycosyltransferase involved in cell wall biosynthesis